LRRAAPRNRHLRGENSRAAEARGASLPTGEALVQVGETITIAAHNDHNTITHLIRFLEWMRAGGTIQGDER